MEKLFGYAVRLAGAILVLTISICTSLFILLATMPMVQDLSLQLTLVHWNGYNLLINNGIKMFVSLVMVAIAVKLIFAKPKETQKQ
jgi:hypothetical protein